MSVYYSAFLGKKTKDKNYEIIGPYVKGKNGELKIKSMWSRSQSFIHWREWDTFNIPVDRMGKIAKELCSDESIFGEEEYSIGYWVSQKQIYARGSCQPIRGYLPIDMAAALIASGYDQDFISWNMESTPLPAEALAGMVDEERCKYSFVAYMDFESTEYHMWELGCILNGYEEYILLEEDEELGIIFQVG